MARAALNWGVRELARASGVSANTISRFENRRSEGHASTLRLLRQTLEAAGVIFIDANGDGPGVRLRKHVSGPSSGTE